jgi:hypothetical protein
LSATVFFITPPFTQLNTPYPATAYLKGFLNTKGISSFQSDLGIEVMMAIFSKKGLKHLFESIRLPEEKQFSEAGETYIPKIKDAIIVDIVNA